MSGTARTLSAGERLGRYPAGTVDALFQLVNFPPSERIQALRHGLPAKTILVVADEMGWSREHAIRVLQLSRSTVNDKLRHDKPLDTPNSERLLGVLELIELARRIVERSGDSQAFDAGRWLGQWLETPNPALGGQLPSTYLDTHEGVQIVRQLLAQMESGAYA